MLTIVNFDGKIKKMFGPNMMATLFLLSKKMLTSIPTPSLASVYDENKNIGRQSLPSFWKPTDWLILSHFCLLFVLQITGPRIVPGSVFFLSIHKKHLSETPMSYEQLFNLLLKGQMLY